MQFGGEVTLRVGLGRLFDGTRAGGAARSVADSERTIRAALAELGTALPAAQAAHREAILSCQAASDAFSRLPEGVVAQHPPSPFDPLLTDGVAMTRFAALPVWKVMA